MDDLPFAQLLADLAAEVSMEYFSGGRAHERPRADGTLVSDADLAVEQALLDRLARQRPHNAVLSEESGPIGQGNEHRRPGAFATARRRIR